MDDEWAPYEDLIQRARGALGGNIIPVLGIRVFQFIDPDGDSRYDVQHAGDATISATIGAIEVAKLNLYDRTFHGCTFNDSDDDGDDDG